MRCDDAMADVESEGRGGTLLPGAHRLVRTLDPAEGPFAGALVTRGDAVAVRVDAAAIAGWAAWRFAGADHIAAPMDVIRRPNGHDALLPWCTERVATYLVKRAAAGSALSSGECSTLVVSILRGVDELGRGPEQVQTGVWWLTDGGRPVFVIAEGEDARAGAAQIVGLLAEQCGDKVLARLLTSVHQGITAAMAQPRIPHRLLEHWERELLLTAAPRPLRRDAHAPERARDVARAAAAGERRSSSANPARRSDRRVSARRGALAPRRVRTRPRPLGIERVAAGAAAVRAAVATFRRAVRSRSDGARVERRRRAAPTRHGGGPASSRRRAVLIAGAAAAIVLAGGMLWPGGGAGDAADPAQGASSPEHGSGESPSQAGDDAAEVAGDGTDGEDAQAAPSPSPSTADGPVAAATELLSLIEGCAEHQDPVCPGAVAPGSEPVIEALGSATKGGASVELVDEYGDVAVIRLSSPGGDSGEKAKSAAVPEQMLVLVRQDEEWLVRDVYGVADQPG